MSEQFESGSASQMRIPLFPLNTVLVPGLVMPLRLFEPRYLLLAETLMEYEESDRYFGIVKSIAKPSPEIELTIHTVGTIAQVQSIKSNDDGEFELVAVGSRRFRILELHQDLMYLTADVELYPEESTTEMVDPLLLKDTLDVFDKYREVLGVSLGSESTMPDDAHIVSYLITAAAMLTLDERQLLLEILSTDMRLREIRRILKRENAILKQVRCFPTFEPTDDFSLN